MSLASRALAALLGLALAGCPPSPRGSCSRDADCASGPAGLFCADGVCQAPPAVRLSLPTGPATRADTAVVRAQIDRAHGGPDAATAELTVAGTTLQPVREGPGALRFDVPLSLAPANTEGALPVHIVVRDDQGHETALDAALPYDDAPPQLAFADDGAWHPRAPLTITTTVRDANLDESSIRLAVGGLSLAPTSTSGDTRSFAVPAEAFPAGAEGPVPLQLSARDGFGHAATVMGRVLVDDKAPRITVDPATIPSAPTIRGDTIHLSVNVSDTSPVSVQWSLSGQPALQLVPSQSSTYNIAIDTTQVLYSSNTATISISARDQANNSTTVSFDVSLTRVHWVARGPAERLAGLGLQNSSLIQVSVAGNVTRLDARGLKIGSLTLKAPPQGYPLTDESFVYAAFADNSVCATSLGAATGWCCPAVGPTDSSGGLAVGAYPDGLGKQVTTLFLANTSTASDGQRLYALRGDASGHCMSQASLPLVPFQQATPAISQDGTIYIATAEAIVAGRFDGFAWATRVIHRLKRIYRGQSAFLAPTAAGQSLLTATNLGLVEELVFPSSADPSGLPGLPLPTPPSGFSTDVSSGSGYGASGATVAADGTIIVGTEDRRLVALDPAGNVKWSVQLAGRPGGPPTQGAGGIAYAVDETGAVTAVNVADGSVRWTFMASAPLRVPPALGCDGTLYVGADDGTVYGLVSDSSGLANSPWPRVGRDNRGTGDARRILRGSDGSCLE